MHYAKALVLEWRLYGKIWITGAKGHVGTALSALLDCREYEIFPTDVDEVDVTDLEAVNNYARVNRPDIIINCVGYSDVAGRETNPDKAFAVNAVGTRNLAVMAQSIGAKLIHISTDDIFSGTEDHSYNEFDTPNLEIYMVKASLPAKLIYSLSVRVM